MGFKGWIEVIVRGGGDRMSFGLRGEASPGRAFECTEGTAPSDKDPIRDVLGLDFEERKTLTARRMDVPLVLCAAKRAPERLRALGWSCTDSGMVRVASLARLDRFARYSGADPTLEMNLQGTLRTQFEDRGGTALVGFESAGSERWMFARVDDPKQIRFAAGVLDQVFERIRKEMEKADRRHAPADARRAATMERFLSLVETIAGQLFAALARPSGPGAQSSADRLLGRLDREWPALLAVGRSPDARAVVTKLIALFLWGKQGPTQEQMAQFLRALGPEITRLAYSAIARQIEEARRAEEAPR